ncbi:MgtC/SapB family protein [Rhodopirellula europaea]|uniref:MgtC/SapB family protein n=1 Tax=Rhodopirellula europaea TaxID=1263866 RepID=UPI003D28DB42|tara:strand:+ start:2487 stop:2975 length:489 start_codon:yes stop_codon:yes gene_type:complete
MMDWQLELMYALRAIGAAVLGGFIGWEREWHGSEAGVRTYSSVALGSCVFALISSHIPDADPARLAANIVTGVGFLGAGIIMQNRDRIVGLTTAGTVWATAAVGTAVGFGMYLLGILTAAMVFGILAAHHLPGWKKLAEPTLEETQPTNREESPSPDVGGFD